MTYLPFKLGYTLGLGSNSGWPQCQLHRAIESMKIHCELEVSGVSSCFQSAPHDCDLPQPDYYNLVVVGKSRLKPYSMLIAVKNIERRLGRVVNKKKGNLPRTIDIDILLIDDMSITSPTLTIPHKKMHERDFVTQPLLELLNKNPNTSGRARKISSQFSLFFSK